MSGFIGGALLDPKRHAFLESPGGGAGCAWCDHTADRHSLDSASPRTRSLMERVRELLAHGESVEEIARVEELDEDVVQLLALIDSEDLEYIN